MYNQDFTNYNNNMNSQIFPNPNNGGVLMNNFVNPNNPNFNNYFFNNMGINNNMNMNMFNVMMNYLQQYWMMQNNMNNMNNTQNFMNNSFNKMTIIPNESINKGSQTQKFSKSFLPKINTQFQPLYPGCTGELINIFFQTPTGHKINMLTPCDAKIKDLLVQYVLKIGLGPNVIDEAIYFLYGGGKLKKNEKKTLYEKNIINGAVIIVIDKQGVMGA